MPPEERFLPRFAAEPPQEDLPYGRWEERLRQELLGAALTLDGEPEDLGEPGAIAWYPDRTWHGYTYVPAATLTSTGYELFGYVRFLPGVDDGEPSDFTAHVDFTDETAERNPDWKLDLCDEIIGSWRGEAGASAAMTLVWGRPLLSGGRVVHGETFALEHESQRGANVVVVFHNQNSRHPNSFGNMPRLQSRGVQAEVHYP